MNKVKKKYIILATVATAIVLSLIILLPLFNIGEFKHRNETKAKIENAQLLFDQKDYLGAIRIYKTISKSEYDGSKLDLAKERYYAQTKELVDDCLEKGDFKGAVNSYKVAIENLGTEDAGVLMEGCEKLESNYKMYVTPSIRIERLRTLHPRDRLDNKENKNVVVYKVYDDFGEEIVENCSFVPEIVKLSGKNDIAVWVGDEEYQTFVDVGAECERIELSTEKEDIYLDEAVLPKDIMVKAFFGDDSSEEYCLEDILGLCEISDLNPKEKGQFNVKVKLWGKKGKIAFVVKERPHVTAIEAECLTEPTVGDVLENSLFRVRAIYSDSTQQEISDFTISKNKELNKVGENKVTIKWTDSNGTSFTCGVMVNVLPKLISLKVKYLGKAVAVGSVITKDMLKVEGEYSDKSRKKIKAFVIDYNVIDNIGENTVTVSYGGISGSVTVVGIGITGITAKYNGEPLMVGDSIDVKKIKCTANYSDGSKAAVMDFTINKSVINSIGDNKVTVYYNGKTTDVTITGTEKKYTVESENNDSLSSANNIMLNRKIEARLDDDDRDCFKIELENSGLVSIKVSSAAISKLYITLYNVNGDTIEDWSVSQGSTTGKIDDETAFYLNKGVFYIQVESYYENGAYGLQCDYTSSKVNHTEGNNSLSNASGINMGEEIIGQLSATTYGVEDDYFKVELKSSGWLAINFTSSSFEKIYLELHVANGDSLYRWTASEKSTTGKINDKTTFYLNKGVYYIRIESYSGSGVYGLQCDYKSSKVNHSEGNNSLSKACEINMGEELIGQLSDTTDGIEADYFMVNLKSSGRLTVNLTSSSFEKIYLDVYVANGDTLYSWTAREESITGKINDKTLLYLNKGVYYIKIESYSESGVYGLQCDFKSSKVNHTEGNNSFSNACGIKMGEEIIGQLSETTDEIEDDYFKVDLKSKGRITIKFTSSSFDKVYLTLYDANGNTIDSWSESRGSTTEKIEGSTSFDLKKGSYYLKIDTYNNGGIYKLLIR